MANGSIITNSGKSLILQRAYESSPSVTAISEAKIGILNGTPSVTSTDLDTPVPIEDGTINDDGTNLMTGSSGGDNTTDNTTTFKEGSSGIVSDTTAQNLNTNTSSATKQWAISSLSSAGTAFTGTDYGTLWLYIKDSTTLAYFLSSGTALEVRLGSDSSNYYSLTKTAADLSTGWNWISSYPDAFDQLTETGTVTGTIDYFAIIITTNNATDSWTEGDVVYDLLRGFVDSDFTTSFDSSYPNVNTTDLEVETQITLNSLKANGFDINGLGLVNTDSSPIFFSEDTFTSESKSSTDVITFICKDRII